MAFPAFTSTEATPITIRKATLLSGTVFNNQAMRVDYNVPASVACTQFACTAIFSIQADSSATSMAAARILYLYADCDVDPGEGSFIRMDDNGDYPLDSYFEFAAKSQLGPTYLMQFTTNSATCWDHNEALSLTPSGRLTIRVGSHTRYIALYSA